MIEKVTVPGAIELDQLRGDEAPVQVLLVDDGGFDTGVPRDPHRHDYHELIVVRAGVTRHDVDGTSVEVAAGQALLIGRGQVHVFESSESFRGGVVRFREELLGGTVQEASPDWLVLGEHGARVLDPPVRDLDHVLATLRTLDDELRRPVDASSQQVITGALGLVLGLVRRWCSPEPRPATAVGPDVTLLRGFSRLLEAEYQRHHDAAWYADELGVTANHLASVLTRMTGRSTKRHVTDRLMTEVSRLLRFTDLTVQQVALRLGYDDPLYLSRAFKAQTGLAPSAWRERQQGRA